MSKKETFENAKSAEANFFKPGNNNSIRFLPHECTEFPITIFDYHFRNKLKKDVFCQQSKYRRSCPICKAIKRSKRFFKIRAWLHNHNYYIPKKYR